MMRTRVDIGKLKYKISNSTEKFFTQLSRTEQKKIGQFTTPTQVAEYMAERLLDKTDFSANQTIKILDPGSGTGVLGLTVVENLFMAFPHIPVKLVTYENEPIALEVLRSNLALTKDWAAENELLFTYEVRERNYILEGDNLFQDSAYSYEDSYDLIVANPPYKKLSKKSLEADVMNFVVHGAPNLYGLFWAKSAIELRSQATSAFIIPRSWMSGAYFERLRQFMFAQGSIAELHAFNSRNNIFGSTKVLQELVIVIFQKKLIKNIKIWAHNDITTLNDNNPLIVSRRLVVVGPERRVYLITNKHELTVAKWAGSLPSTFVDSGLRMKTGLTVCFRNRDLVEDKATNLNVPIFYAENFYGHGIRLKREKGQYLSKQRSGFLQNNVNYVFVKRFSTKEEKRRIQTAFYDAHRFLNEKISTDNKINFVIAKSDDLLKGAFLVLSSTIFDEYYRLLSGNTQVNSTEVNSMKFPDESSLSMIGAKYSAEQLEKIQQDEIDQIVLENFGGEE